MNILKFLLYFLLSIFSKKKRYVILTPNLLYFFIKNVFIYDKQTGAYNSVRVINDITKNIRASQSTRVIG